MGLINVLFSLVVSFYVILYIIYFIQRVTEMMVWVNQAEPRGHHEHAQDGMRFILSSVRIRI